MGLASLIIAIIAILISIASAVYSRRQAVASSSVAEIEAARRHDQLTPHLSVTCVTSGTDNADLTVELTGPDGLDRLDGLTVVIRDDRPDRGKRTPGMSDRGYEELQDVIWGPCRINTGTRDTSRNGREHGPVILRRQEPYLLSLERSISPSWIHLQKWRQGYESQPVRLTFKCRRDGHEPWEIQKEVTLKVSPDDTQFVW